MDDNYTYFVVDGEMQVIHPVRNNLDCTIIMVDDGSFMAAYRKATTTERERQNGNGLVHDLP